MKVQVIILLQDCIIERLQFQLCMRLQFQLKKVKISPVCHIQINRQAEQFRGKYAIGQIYGALYDDEAHITNVMPYPDEENMPTREQLQAMERRHEEMLHKYNLDTANIGWYMVSFKQSLWKQLAVVQYNQKCINTSFFLVYDYEARLVGKNPYKAYRLTDQFALREDFNFSQLGKTQLENPFVQIPVQVQKDQIFQALLLFNKQSLIKEFMRKSNVKQRKDILKNKIESFMETLQQQSQNNKNLSEKKAKDMKNLTFTEYCQNMGILLKAENQEKQLRKYEQNINLTKQILQTP